MISAHRSVILAQHTRRRECAEPFGCAPDSSVRDVVVSRSPAMTWIALKARVDRAPASAVYLIVDHLVSS